MERNYESQTAAASFRRVVVLALGIAFSITTAVAADSYFANWPDGADPKVIGKRVAENFVVRPPAGPTVHYREVCSWHGGLAFAELTKDTNLTARLIDKFQPVLTTPSRVPPRDHVDDKIVGAVPLEIYLETGNTNDLAFGLRFADSQWSKTMPDGISTEARYWVDDMWMMTLLQLDAYRATQDVKYRDRMALTMAAYLDRLQQPNGLFHHATNAPFFWSRGNGWFAAGMAEMLRALPEAHPQRARIMKGYQAMLASLLQYQGDDGLWKQLIDHPEAWPETSGSAMFTFAMVTGVKNGWLDAAKYGPAARKAWLGLVGNLDADANLKNVCIGTGAGTSVPYYLNRQRITGDLHGQAPMLWTATALLQ